MPFQLNTMNRSFVIVKTKEIEFFRFNQKKRKVK